MLTVTAVVTAHGPDSRATEMVEQLRRQSRPPDEILVYGSDLTPGTALSLAGMADFFAPVPNMEDWGHEKRAQGLHDATSNLVGFFNDDDHYDPTFIERMADGLGPCDLILCAFQSRLVGTVNFPLPQVGYCTSGNFLVRRELAQQVGWNHRVYDGDGRFIMDLVSAGATWCTIPDILYEHR